LPPAFDLCYDAAMELQKDRRLVHISSRAGKFKLEFYLTFEDDPGYKELVGAALVPNKAAAVKKAEAWLDGAA